jgi:hypothetical protein
MYSDLDYEEWRWQQILTRPIHPDDQPPTDEDEDAQTQE